jgi:hypothetical protein
LFRRKTGSIIQAEIKVFMVLKKKELIMNKFFRISVIVVLVLAVAITAFAFTSKSSQLAFGKIQPYVGWNSGIALNPSALQNTQAVAWSGGLVRPMVGWNS